METLFQMDFELLIVQKPGNDSGTQHVAVGRVLLWTIYVVMQNTELLLIWGKGS